MRSAFALLLLGLPLVAAEPLPLPHTTLLTNATDLSQAMVAGIDRFLLRETDLAAAHRGERWKRDFGSAAAYEKSIATNRENLRRMIGAVDPRLPSPTPELVATLDTPAEVAETDRFTARAVRWPVLEGVFGEGLLIQPKGRIRARVVAIPDADQTPELICGLARGLAPEAQFARRLAENGCEVLVLTLVNREDTWSGNEKLKRFTNQPHREWIYRQAYELGRHLIGYEVQKVIAAVDWFERPGPAAAKVKVGVAGYGEGGLIAFYAAAVDPRIQAALVSGYFEARQRLWNEPIYRNVFGLLREFGDAEIASLIAPRSLVVEFSETPRIEGPPRPRNGRGGAAPGGWTTPEFNTVDAEVNRARALVRLPDAGHWIDLINGSEGLPIGPGSSRALGEFLGHLGSSERRVDDPGPAPRDARVDYDPGPRQKRQVEELTAHTQRLLASSQRARQDAVWSRLKVGSSNEYASTAAPLREFFWNDVIGRFPPASLPAAPRSRQVYDEAAWTGYDVMLDVWPDVFAWGVLLLPKDLKPGEQRPVVVCQHGLEGVPADTITLDPKAGGFGPYQGFSARLAERGFIVFAPHNPYRGRDAFRVLQRKANPLGRSLFSVIVAQHERILEWLAAQPFVDPERIAFYGLSYGGKTAMRVPALLERYCLSICSADFNEWVLKNATTESPYSYMFTMEYEMPEWDLGHTFNYAEMAALIAPRPFMVERGHNDGVAPDEWVAYEFARVRRHYARLGLAERAQIEFFNGPHTIHGVGTFAFLHQHLNWPAPK
jgi:dienelactone hydrolase